MADKNKKSTSPWSSENRPKLGTGLLERAAQALAGRQKQIDKQVQQATSGQRKKKK